MDTNRVTSYVALIMAVFAFWCVISLSGDVKKLSNSDNKVVLNMLNRIESLERRLFNVESSMQCEEYEQYELERKHNTRHF